MQQFTTKYALNKISTHQYHSSLHSLAHNFHPTFLDASLSFVYNYKPANFKEDFISALTALVTAQDDPQRLKELTKGAKSILNDYKDELPNILRQVKSIFFLYLTIIDRFFQG